MNTGRWFKDEDWSLVEVRGADRSDFLKRLTTNTLPQSESPLVHNFFLSVNARVQAEFWVSAQTDYLALLVPLALVQNLKDCIDRYHFGEKIEVSEPVGNLYVLSDVEIDSLSQVKAFSPDPRYGEDCHWCFVLPEQEPDFINRFCEADKQMTLQEAEQRRIALGRPKFGTDYDGESLFVEIAQQGDFSESKGCYPGQEIVARVLHRGRLNKHLRGFRSDLPIGPGWHKKVDGKEVASTRSIVSDDKGGSVGFLSVRREYGQDGNSLTGINEQGEEQTLVVTPRALELLTGDEE